MKKILMAAFALLFFLLIAACVPVCSADQVTAPIALLPDNVTTVSVANPELNWQYGTTCNVENFHFEVSTDPLMNHPDLTGDTHHHYLGFSTPIEFLDEDCTAYYWRVTAEADGASVASAVSSFYTDFTGSCPILTECADAPAAPIAKVPYSGQRVTDPQQQLIWEAGDAHCAVDLYNPEVAETPAFSHFILLGGSPYPWLTFAPADPYLEDCHTYFWRVVAESAIADTPSNIIQFWTDFEGTCPAIPICRSDQLGGGPTLLDPIGGEIVTIPNPDLVYQFYTYECAMESGELWVSEDPGFATYALHGTMDYSTSEYPNSSIFGTGIEYLDDCTTYYWKVEMTVGLLTTLTSPVETFETDFNGTCLRGDIDLGLDFEDLYHLESFNIGCSDADTMFTTFDFEEPILGSYEAHIGLRTWPCSVLQGHEDVLICSGQAVSQGVDVQVDLFSLDTQEVVLSQTGFSALCAGVTICQPPAEGCSPKMMGYDPLKQPIYVPTFWDSNQCACVPK